MTTASPSLPDIIAVCVPSIDVGIAQLSLRLHLRAIDRL